MDEAKYVIDCDPGHDDAVAILYGAAHAEVLGITTVFGNAPVEHTTRNALRICELAQLELPVARGMGRPLVGEAVHASDAHGVTGLDGVDLPEPARKPLAQHAVDYLIEQAAAYPGVLVIVAVGPLTNVAMALHKEPRLTEWLRGITIMGGSTHVGNMTSVAESNISADPEAAHVVLQSGIPLHMVGLNVTRELGVTPEDIVCLRQPGYRVAPKIADLLEFYLQRQQVLYARNVAPMHDVCAWMPYLHPTWMQYQEAHVEVELCGRHTRGMTVCDLRGLRTRAVEKIQPPADPNVQVALAADRDAIIHAVVETLLVYG
jgi:inosine-uridine nucleoside N-ribohydrolase